MHVLVRVRGELDDLDLWPYTAGPRTDVDGGAVLILEVHDTQELVGALAELSRRGIAIVKVDTLDADAVDGGSPDVGG